MSRTATAERPKTRKAARDGAEPALAKQLRDLHAAWVKAQQTADASSAEITALETGLAKEIYATTFWQVESLEHTPLEKLVQLARKHEFGYVVGNQMEVRTALYSRVNKEVEEVRQAKEILQKLIAKTIADRRPLLTQAYGETLEHIAKVVRPFCVDEDEAFETAKLFTVATSLHARLWDLSKWSAPEYVSNLVDELETPIRRIAA
ncbi:MAG: hypothetical protein P4L99_04935 [Chthoniobacter sp.]|nr:hypothetical protein [Chthoniobacter sp.]